jgi:2-polyprenyl-3-methyl-5-hydroxy-6-metoxy-1,4-benzoquinol methylase
LQTPTCPICGGTTFHAWMLGLIQCNSCKIILSPSVWQPLANEQMESDWFGEDYQPQKSFWVEQFEALNNRKTLGRIAVTRAHGQRLLEIGVGSGSFLKAARKQGYEVVGCDLSAPICDRVRKVHGIEMHCGALATLTSETGFDVIVLNHVLEHVPSPVEFLREVNQLLSADGIVHIAVPNVDCWEARLSGWTSFEPYHLTYFAPATLKATVGLSGLSVVNLTTHDSFSGWFLAVLRTVLGVNRSFGAVTRSLKSKVGRASGQRFMLVEHLYRMAMVVFGAVIWPIRFIQTRIGRGDEIICIARKREGEPTQSCRTKW